MNYSISDVITNEINFSFALLCFALLETHNSWAIISSINCTIQFECLTLLFTTLFSIFLSKLNINTVQTKLIKMDYQFITSFMQHKLSAAKMNCY